MLVFQETKSLLHPPPCREGTSLVSDPHRDSACHLPCHTTEYCDALWPLLENHIHHSSQVPSQRTGHLDIHLQRTGHLDIHLQRTGHLDIHLQRTGHLDIHLQRTGHLDIHLQRTGHLDIHLQRTGHLDIHLQRTGHLDIHLQRTGHLDIHLQRTGHLDILYTKDQSTPGINRSSICLSQTTERI